MINVGFGLLDTAYTEIKPGTMSGHLPFDDGHGVRSRRRIRATRSASSTPRTRAAAAAGSARLDYNYQGQFWRSEPFLRVSGYQRCPIGYDESGDWGIVNLRFTYEPADANWQAALFGTNLTDEYMINSGFFHGIWGYDFATVARPREVGASLDVPLLRRKT